jgi:hypothetical protein
MCSFTGKKRHLEIRILLKNVHVYHYMWMCLLLYVDVFITICSLYVDVFITICSLYVDVFITICSLYVDVSNKSVAIDLYHCHHL